MEHNEITPRVDRIQRDIETLSTYVESGEEGWTRRAFTEAYNEGRAWLKLQMETLEMETATDAAGNIVGKVYGSERELPSIIVGSHTDTVRGGGRFDGIAGVLGGLEVVRLLREENIKLRHTLEIIDFTAEEPTDFGASTIGSRAMAGKLTEEMLERVDNEGITLGERLEKAGGKPLLIDRAKRSSDQLRAYFELHIEQGPILYNEGRSLGIVTGIVGIQRHRIEVVGCANHAGTTPMGLRQDALAAGSEMILALESICSEEYSDNVVGTVGKVKVEPNASNVIPGKVVFEMEIRCVTDKINDGVFNKIIAAFEVIAIKRGVSCSNKLLSKSKGLKIDREILRIVEEACLKVGRSRLISSGAGHDANHIAELCPVGMIFVPSRDGISHNPREWTDYEDVALGVKALLNCILEADKL